MAPPGACCKPGCPIERVQRGEIVTEADYAAWEESQRLKGRTVIREGEVRCSCNEPLRHCVCAGEPVHTDDCGDCE